MSTRCCVLAVTLLAQVLLDGLPRDFLKESRDLRIQPAVVRKARWRLAVQRRIDRGRPEIRPGEAGVALVRIVQVHLRIACDRFRGSEARRDDQYVVGVSGNRILLGELRGPLWRVGIAPGR